MTMSYDIYLSYSGRHSYKICPKKYQFQYILKDKSRGDPRGSLFGSIIGKIFEWFYTRRAWSTSNPTETVISYIDDATKLVFEQEHFDPVADPAFCSLLRVDLFKYVPEGVETIRKHGFLTVQSRAEIDLTVEHTSKKHGLTLKIGGRADFVHGSSDKDVWLIDGKGSKHRDKYVDAEQLIWYAVQHYIKYHVAPTRLGFMFWCFPEDPIKWIAYDNATMRASLDNTYEIAHKIQLRQFDATPSVECNRCNFKDKCDEGRHFLTKKKVESGGRIENSIFDIEPV